MTNHTPFTKTTGASRCAMSLVKAPPPRNAALSPQEAAAWASYQGASQLPLQLPHPCEVP
eukprot:5548688-Amphidinium_carterae.3